MMYECTGCHAYDVQPIGKISTKDNGAERHSPATGPPVDQFCRNCGQIHHVCCFVCGKNCFPICKKKTNGVSYIQIGGPAWGAPLHDKTFVKKMLEHVKANESNYGTFQRMKGMLTVISEELDAPLYWTLQRLCGTLHCNSIPMVDLL